MEVKRIDMKKCNLFEGLTQDMFLIKEHNSYSERWAKDFCLRGQIQTDSWILVENPKFSSRFRAGQLIFSCGYLEGAQNLK